MVWAGFLIIVSLGKRLVRYNVRLVGQVDSKIPLYGPDGVRFISVLLGCWLSVYGPHVLCIFAPSIGR